MKDEEFVFYEDVREKSITARSSHNRARPARRPQINNYTKGELKKLNGPVHSYNLNEPMTYEAFRALPETIRAEYLQGLVDKYAIGPNALAKYFGRSGPTMSAMCRKLGVKVGGHASHKATAAFLEKFKPAEEKSVTPPVEQNPEMALQNMSICFAGAYSPEAIAQRLNVLLPVGQSVKIRVEIDVAL